MQHTDFEEPCIDRRPGFHGSEINGFGAEPSPL
jgi:hypothetical protein